MKKLTLYIIICISLLFSIVNNTQAEDYIEYSFNLDIWSEIYEINKAKIDFYKFNDYRLTKLYKQIKIADNYLKDGVIKKYKFWEYTYYQTQGIIKNYNNFIYYVNQFFYYSKQKELNPSYKWYDYHIGNSYNKLRNYYIKVKTLTNKRDLN